MIPNAQRQKRQPLRRNNALDYIMFEECEKGAGRGQGQGGNGKGGCLGVVILLAVPAGLFAALWRAIFVQ